MTDDPVPLPTPTPAATTTRSTWPRLALIAVLIVGLLVVASVTTGSDDGGEDALETSVTGDDRDEDSHTPRPSGDDAQRPAPADEHLVLVGDGLLDDDSLAGAAPGTSAPADATSANPSSSPARGEHVGSGGPFGALSPRSTPDDAGPGATDPAAPARPRSDRASPDGDTPSNPGPRSSNPIHDPVPIVPPKDQIRCPMVDLHAIGDLPEDADATLAGFGARFRAMAGPELDREELVCAGHIHRWRDLVIQRLYVGAVPDGVLAASADGRGDVIRFTFPEWKGYRLTGEDDLPFNLGGRPTHREVQSDHSIVRTTNGGLVSRRPDTHGFLVINGAWTVWAEQGARSTMGFPETQPALSGTLGIYQDFANGWIQIPGVINPFEAELLGPEAYVWHPVPDPQADVPADALGNVLEVNETSWFIDSAGVRHWIPDASEFNCAIAENRARKISVRGWVAATFPIGEPYACATG